MSDDRAPRYMEGDTVVYRASSFGMCEVALAAYGLGHEGDDAPEWMKERYEEGNRLESMILAKVEALAGMEMYDHGQRTVELEIGEVNGRKVIVRGHIDGMGAMAKNDCVVEVKALAPSMFSQALRDGVRFHPAYEWQAAIYMHATDMGLVWAAMEKVVNDVGGDADTPNVRSISPGRFHVQILDTPPIRLLDIKRRIARVEAVIEKGVLPDCSGIMFPCPMFKLHTPDEKVFVLPDEELKAMVGQYNAAAVAMKGFEKTRKELGSAIKKWFEVKEADKSVVLVDGVEYTVSRVQSDVPEVLTKAHKKDFVTVSPRRKGKKDE